MTLIDKACWERGCACHDDRVDGETVKVVLAQPAPVQEPNIGALGMPVNVPVTPAGSAEAFCSQEIQDLTSLGARLALELECLLLESKDTAAISKWWDTAHEALADWHDHLWQVSHGDNYVSPLGKD